MSAVADKDLEEILLPTGWMWTKLGEIVEFQYGKGLTEEKRNPKGDIPVYGSNGIVGFHSSTLVNESCLIIGRKGAAGEVHLSKGPCYPIDTTYYVVPLNGVEISFLFYLLKKLRLNALDKSTAIPGLNRNDAYAVSIPLPPLPEQHQIVEEIERRFSMADEVEKVVEQSLKQAERLRQSILKRAFEGKLVPQWPDLPAPQPDKYWVYVIKCDNDSNYIGQTDNLRKRWEDHLSGEGAEWTKSHPPQYIMYWEEFSSRKEAVIKEKWLKTGFGRKWIKRKEKAGRLWHAGEPAEKLLERIKDERTKQINNDKVKSIRRKAHDKTT